MNNTTQDQITNLLREITELENKQKNLTLQQADKNPQPSNTYIIYEATPEKTINILKKQSEKGIPTTYITRTNPAQAKQKLEKTRVIWLTTVKSEGDTESISGLQELSILLTNQIQQNHTILLEGIEYLISNNDFSSVLKLIQQTRDKTSTTQATLIISVNPNAMDKKQLTLIDRECAKI